MQKIYSRKPCDPLNVRRLPARLDAEETAILLGLQPYEVTHLIHAKLLHPLGNVAQNSHKWFASAIVDQVRTDADWIHAATKAIQKRIKYVNRQDRSAPEES